MHKRLSYANVVSTIALIFALGTGGAWAATQIHGKLLKKNTVTGSKLKKSTLTHREINEAKLKTVPKAKDAQTLAGLGPSAFLAANAPAPTATNATNAANAANADALGGIGPGGFIQGQGRQSFGRTTGAAGADGNVIRAFQTPVGEFRLSCNAASADVRYFNTTPGAADVYRFHFRGVAGDDDTNFDVVPSPGDVGYSATEAVGPVYVDIRAGKGDAAAILRVGERRTAGGQCIWNWELLTG